jgi:hypothetical protein
MIAQLFASAFAGFSSAPAEAIAEVLEVFCWCAALATWLMLLGASIREVIRPLAKNIRRLWIEAGRKAKAK